MDAAAGDCLAAPATAALPEILDWTCPAGWTPAPAFALTSEEQAAGRVPAPLICEPPAPPTDCADGTMAVVGEAACQAIGAPCPVGEWPEDLPGGGTVVYVQAGGSGDGSSTSTPLGTIAEAVTQAPDNAVIALAKGTYSLWGAIEHDSPAVGPIRPVH